MKQSIQKETEIEFQSILQIIINYEELLKNKLSSYLKEFQKLTDWPSVNNWLLKLEQAFKDHPTPYLEDKLVLAKRLSQCLNHNLPVGTHKSTLTVYKLIFNNLKLISNVDDSPDSVRKHIANNLQIFSLGLFPFFQYSSIQLKPDILDIIETHFFPLEMDLIPCSAGLVVSILPGLIENNEELQRKTFLIFEQLQQKIGNKPFKKQEIYVQQKNYKFNIKGKKYLYGALWLSILRLPRTRVAAYTCLTKLFKKNDQQQQNIPVDVDANIIKQLQNNQFATEDILLQKAEETSEQYAPFFKVYEQQRNIDVGKYTNLTDNLIIQIKTKSKYFKYKQGNKLSDDQFYEEENIINEQEIMLRNISNSIIQNNVIFINIFQLTIKDEIKNQDGFDSRFPNKSALILNALVATLEDENNQTKKLGLDFLLNYFPVGGNQLSESDKLVLTQSVLYLFLKNEYSIVWKCHQWLFGEADMNSNFQIGDNNRVVLDVYIKNALINIFDHIHNELTSPIKIIQTFYLKNNHMISESLKNISFYLIKYIKMNFNNQGIQKSSVRLFECVYSQFDVIFSSLCDHYEELIKLNEYASNKKDYYFDEQVYTLEIIEFTFLKMFSSNQDMEFIEINKILQPLISRLISYLANQEVGQMIIICLFNIINILVIQNNKSNMIDDEHYILLRCIFQLIEYLRKILEGLEKTGSDIQLLEMEQMYIKYVQTFEQYYQRLCYHLTETIREELLQEKKKHHALEKIDLFSQKISSSSGGHQQGSIEQNRTDEQGHDRKYSEDQTDQNQKRYEECLYKMFDQSSRIVISFYKLYLGYFNWEVKLENNSPEWLSKIYQIIEQSRHYFPKIELFCIDSLIEILIYESKHQERFHLLMKFVEEDSKITQITKILWQTLESSNSQKKIIDYLVILMNKFPQLFSQVVESSFKQNNSYRLQQAMKGFMSFYRMTNNYITKNSSKNLGCGLFQMLDLLSNKNPILRNAVKTFLIENTGLLFRVLDPFLIEFLECQHSAKVQQKFSNFYIYENTYNVKRMFYLIKLIEQTLEILKDMFVGYIFQVKISTHLSNKIKSSKFYVNSQFNIEYFIYYLNNQYFYFYKIMKNQFDLSNATYMDVLCNIMVRFIQGQTQLDLLENRQEIASCNEFYSDHEDEQDIERQQLKLGGQSQSRESDLESPKLMQKQKSRKRKDMALDEEFRIENQQMNSVCSEFLDKLIQYADQKQTVIKILNLTLEKILITLKYLIENKNLVIQVELLSLIQAIIMKFKHIYKKKIPQEPPSTNTSNASINTRTSSTGPVTVVAEESMRNTIEMFGSQLFFANLLEGFDQTEDHFVRSRYIYVVTIGIWTLSDAFSNDNLKDIVNLILYKYYRVLRSVQLSQIIQIQDIEDLEFLNPDELEQSNSANGSILQSQLKDSRERGQKGGLLDSGMNFDYSKRNNRRGQRQKTNSIFQGRQDQKQGTKGKDNQNDKGNSNQNSKKVLDDENDNSGNKVDQKEKNDYLDDDDVEKDDFLHGDQDKNLSSQSKCQEVRNICDSLKSILNYFLQFKEPQQNGIMFVSLQNQSSPAQLMSQAMNQQQQHYKMASALYDIITLKFLNTQGQSGNNQQNQPLSTDRFSYLPTVPNQQSTRSSTSSQLSQQSQQSNDSLSQQLMLKFKQHTSACNLIMIELPNLIQAYLNCWSLSHNMEQNIIFNSQGTRFYDFTQFETYNARLQEQLNYFTNTNNDFLFQDLIKVDILSVTYPLISQFPVQTIHALLQLWINQCDQSFFTLPLSRERSNSNFSQTLNQMINNSHEKDNSQKNEQIMMKILEMVSYMNVNIDYLLANLQKSPIVQSLRNYYIQRLQLPKDQALINSQIAHQESQLFFFIFELISYQYIDLQSNSNQQIISSFWFQLISLLSTFNTSKHPTTCIWILDIILAASRKYNPKEILNEKNIRQDLNELIKIHLTNLSNFATQKTLFSSTTERNFSSDRRQSVSKQQPKGQQDQQQQAYFEFFGPLSPTVNELFENYQRNFNSVNNHSSQSFESSTNLNNEASKGQQQGNDHDQQQQSPVYFEIEKYLFSVKNSTSHQGEDYIEEGGRRNSFCSNFSFSSQQPTHPLLTREQFTIRVSILSFKTLKSLLFEVLQNCFDNQNKIMQLSKDILGNIIPKIFIDKKTTSQQLILVECASDLCNRLLLQSPDFIMKEFRKNLLDIFTSNVIQIISFLQKKKLQKQKTKFSFLFTL